LLPLCFSPLPFSVQETDSSTTTRCLLCFTPIIIPFAFFASFLYLKDEVERSASCFVARAPL
jgi:hypothetical protein